MGVGEGERGPLWVVGQLTVRVRGLAPGPGRIVRIPRPFAIIGRGSGVDLRLDDPAVEPCHALLLLDHRGAFGVDLLSATGTRFAGRESGSAWMGVGDVVEVAGHRVELLRFRVDGTTIDPAPPAGNLLDELPGPIGLTLAPFGAAGPPWNLSSALGFIGRDEACAIRLEDEAAAGVHCALFVARGATHAIALPGLTTSLDGVPIAGASTLLDGDVLGIGGSRFAVKIADTSAPTSMHPKSLALFDPNSGVDGPSVADVLDLVRRLRAETATLVEGQIGRIEALDREIAALRGVIDGKHDQPEPGAEPFKLDLSPHSPPPDDAQASWLLDRIDALDSEARAARSGLLGRIVGAVSARPKPEDPDRAALPPAGTDLAP